MGGLDHVFDDLFRRILTPRLLPTKVKSTLGLRQARGVVLYGPPGTGKTMVRAFSIGLLSCCSWPPQLKLHVEYHYRLLQLTTTHPFIFTPYCSRWRAPYRNFSPLGARSLFQARKSSTICWAPQSKKCVNCSNLLKKSGSARKKARCSTSSSSMRSTPSPEVEAGPVARAAVTVGAAVARTAIQW